MTDVLLIFVGVSILIGSFRIAYAVDNFTEWFVEAVFEVEEDEVG